MRPIVWGLILTVVGAFFWVLFSVVFGVASGLAGEEIPPPYMALIYISGATMWFSLPVSIAIEVYRWVKRKASKKAVPTGAGSTG